MGVGVRRQTAAELYGRSVGWKWIGFCVALLGGFLLFFGRGHELPSEHQFSRLELFPLFPLALIWHVVVQKKMRGWTETEPHIFIRPMGRFDRVHIVAVVAAASVGFLLTNALTYPPT
jgi:hypothetical protein